VFSFCFVDKKTIKPRDAAAVVLLKHGTSAENPQICCVKRNANLSFLPGWHAFPGGKLEKSDYETPVENCADEDHAALIVCAAREAFEETGVLLSKGGDKLTRGQRASLHDDLCSGRETFAEILKSWDLWLDTKDFQFVGAWTTPPFSPVRFKTRFFLAVCPPKQTPFAASGELETVEFIRAQDALKKWQNGEMLCAPPILNTFRVFGGEIEPPRRRDAEKNTGNNRSQNLNDSFLASAFLRLGGENPVEKLLSLAKIEGEHPRKIEFNPRFTCFPLRTETLPPATHTNCFIVGRREFVVIDAAAREEAEQKALHEFVDSIVEQGGVCKGIIVSHFHRDHTGGEIALQKHLREKFDQHAPLFAHRVTAENLPEIEFNGFLNDGDKFDLRDENGAQFKLETLHAPGHARGHLCFYDREIGFLLSSDNVIGAGSVLIASPEGNMRDYLNSLQRMRDLPNLRFLCGSHGSALANAREKIENYIQHRLMREQKILAAWQTGARTSREIVERVYADVKPELWLWAEKSVEAHLEKLQADGLLIVNG
jgi:glyoxylase-like metal-dependent hydrolase (beta-lactamase superfamily II)/8-oxo-dGTP pyrophosphatase MutT (NUDIX family)